VDADRRTLIKGLAGLVVLGPATVSFGGNRFFSSPVLRIDRLRPPGAVSEDDFTGQCIRCGRCMEVCPYHCIKPLDIRDGLSAGTPVIDVRESPCFLCMECVVVCPTGALQPIALEETRMGLAVIDITTCAAHQPETLCRTCYSVCPLRDHAIELIEMVPVIVDDTCTGCGVCVQACPVELQGGGRAIAVEPKL